MKKKIGNAFTVKKHEYRQFLLVSIDFRFALKLKPKRNHNRQIFHLNEENS